MNALCFTTTEGRSLMSQPGPVLVVELGALNAQRPASELA